MLLYYFEIFTATISSNTDLQANCVFVKKIVKSSFTFFQDNKADLIINYYVDDVLEKVMSILGIETSAYNENDDFTKLAEMSIVDWTINRKDVILMEKMFKSKCKGVKKKRILIKTKRKSTDLSTENGNIDNDDKSKIIKSEIKEENEPLNV